MTQKTADFYLFMKAVELINAKAHLTVEGLQKIVIIKASSNLGISAQGQENLKNYFTSIIPVERPLVETHNIPDPNWIVGFVSGEGCFDVNLKKSKSHLTGYQVILRFSIKQHERDKSLMELISRYLGCGNVYADKDSCCSLITVKYSDVTELIIPFFETYPVLGEKQYDFSDWCKVATIMIDGSHLTKEGLILIKNIKKGMNRGREKK